MPDFYYAKPGPMTPIALVGHKVAIWAPPNWTTYRVLFREPLPRSAALLFDVGAVAAGVASAATALANLEMSGNPPEMAQLRWYPLDDIRVRLSRGQADIRFKTQNIIAEADLFTEQVDRCLHSTEFVILGEDEPTLTVTNPSDYALAQTRVAFFGYRYILESLKFVSPKVEEVEKALAPITFVAAGGI